MRMIQPVVVTAQGATPLPSDCISSLSADLQNRRVEGSGLPPHLPMSDDERRESYDEREIMERVSADQVPAFDLLVELFWSRTFRYCRSLGCDEDRADDITQEAFIRLWERRKSWSPSGSVKVWLFQTVRNQVVSEKRKWRVRVAWATRSMDEDRPRPPTPLQEMEKLEIRQAVEHAMLILSPRRREAFSLVHLHGLSYREVGQIMNVKPQTVANYLAEALVDLRASLAARFPSLAPQNTEARSSKCGGND
jgi:RNA polymerase sigma-70 factor, ECF subfamily